MFEAHIIDGEGRCELVSLLIIASWVNYRYVHWKVGVYVMSFVICQEIKKGKATYSVSFIDPLSRRVLLKVNLKIKIADAACLSKYYFLGNVPS